MFSFGKHLPSQTQHRCPARGLPYCLLYLGDGDSSWVLLTPFSSPVPSPPCSHQTTPLTFSLVRSTFPPLLPPIPSGPSQLEAVQFGARNVFLRFTYLRCNYPAGTSTKFGVYVLRTHTATSKIFFQMGSYPFFHVPSLCCPIIEFL